MSNYSQDNQIPSIPKEFKFVKHNFSSVKFGIGHYDKGPTGCTVIIFEDENGSPLQFFFFADRRGGAVGAIFDDFGIANGFCFSGGSLYGLEASFGVMKYFHEKNNFSNDWRLIPDVPGAIIFDFGPRSNSVYPDKKLGYFAAKNSIKNIIPIGRIGAGIMATAGKGFDYSQGEFSGQGAAFKEFGATKILVLSVVNSIGAIMDRNGNTVLGHLNKNTNQRVNLLDEIFSSSKEKNPNASNKSKNTTLTLVITNQKFDPYFLKQISRQLHSSMSKMIYPFHTSSDGDILFFASSNEIENSNLSDTKFSILASEVVWDAVLSLVN